jgi:5-methylcytosine-specific restriction enzyme B
LAQKNDSEYGKSYILRNNTKPDALKDNGAFFALISPDEENSGPFHDFSIAIFPNDQGKPWLLALGIGSSGFKNDYELATYPGLRRLFSQLVNADGFAKSDLSDIETSLPKNIVGHESLQHIKNTIKTYTKFLPVCQILHNPNSEKCRNTISAFIAAYAKVRDWPNNTIQRNAVETALSHFTEKTETNELPIVSELLEERRFVVLQGAPGTGKTTLAKQVAGNLDSIVHFTQFHAETSYSDFIYGIRPDVEHQSLSYVSRNGILANAIVDAQNNPSKKVILIIDEINRANLANVLGPAFYLFEHQMKDTDTDIEIEITPSIKVKSLPKNFYVIATMNTSDRSLAVVDFALRRRFAWYNLKPKALKNNNFFKEDFAKIDAIFDWHANGVELSLQPGQGYFIADSEAEMLNRVRYEIYPLIKEYLLEGLLQSAKEELNDYFVKRIQLPIYE